MVIRPEDRTYHAHGHSGGSDSLNLAHQRRFGHELAFLPAGIAPFAKDRANVKFAVLGIAAPMDQLFLALDLLLRGALEDATADHVALVALQAVLAAPGNV